MEELEGHLFSPRQAWGEKWRKRTEKKSDKRLRVADYVELFRSGRLNILSVAPEGDYSLYGNGVDIQPFRSPRSLEIALMADCRIILVIGRGFERWQRNVSIESAWRKRLVRRLAHKMTTPICGPGP